VTFQTSDRPLVESYDVIIAGGGPAGCSAAMVLCQAGLKVCIVDPLPQRAVKEGESLPGAALRLLNRLGIRSMEDLLGLHCFKPCVANASAWGSDQWVYNDSLQNPEGGGWHLDRLAFDQAFRGKALSMGVTFNKAQFKNLSLKPSTETTKQVYEVSISPVDPSSPKALFAPWVIDATGRKSALCEKLQIEKIRLSQQMACLCWLKQQPGDQDNTTCIKSVEQGWWYSARLPGGQRVLSFFGLPDYVTQLVKQPGLFFDSCNASGLLKFAVSAQQIAYPLRAVDASSFKLSCAGAPGWVAVGDAVLANDPLSSQGIFFALYSGVRGAEAILESWGKTEPTEDSGYLPSIQKYQKQVDSVFQANQKSRMYYYSCEQRYPLKDYWRSFNW